MFEFINLLMKKFIKCLYILDYEELEVKLLKRWLNLMDDIIDMYDFLDEDLNEFMKRGLFFWFGKWGVLFWFGKRSEEDKCGFFFRFGKCMDGYYVLLYVSSENFLEKDDKRGSFFWFGKWFLLFWFGRSVDNEKFYMLFCFGCEEEDEI